MWGLSAVAIATFAAVPALAQSAPASGEVAFAWENDGWEGTSRLQAVAQRVLGRRATVTRTLNWREVSPQDGLLILHPKRALNIASIVRFLEAGGRVVLLDDVGTGEPLLSRFGIERVAPASPPDRMLRSDPELALASPPSGVPVHPIARGVSALVTNHPQLVIHPALTPVLEIPSRAEPASEHWLALSGQVERGRFIAIGDSSLLINRMLDYPDNERFAENTLEYLGAEGGRVWLCAGDFTDAHAYGDAGTMASRFVAHLRQWAEALRSALYTSDRARILGILAGALAIACAWAVRQALRRWPRNVPRHLAPAVPSLQGGFYGRAHLLALPSTPSAALLAATKRAFWGEVRARAGQPLRGDDAIAWLTTHASLTPLEVRELSWALAKLEAAEAALLKRDAMTLLAADARRITLALSAALRQHETPP